MLVKVNWKPFKNITFRTEFGYGWVVPEQLVVLLMIIVNLVVVEVHVAVFVGIHISARVVSAAG